jgi:hypothetical protein
MSEAKLIRLTPEIIVNREFVSSVTWDRGYSYTSLIVTMSDGARHYIKHDCRAGGGGNDCYKIERDLLNA